MQTISATELARHTREILDKVVSLGETLVIERNHAAIAQIMPLVRTMTAAQALSGLALPQLTPAQAQAWLQDAKSSFDDGVRNPWA